MISSQAKPMLMMAFLAIANIHNFSFLVKAEGKCKGSDHCGEALKDDKRIGVQLYEENDQVVLDNGILQATFSKPGGAVTRIQYNGMENMIAFNKTQHGGYWSINWNKPYNHGYEMLTGTSYSVIEQSRNRVEISFTRKWDPSFRNHQAPFNIDKRFIMLHNSSGFYSYAIFERSGDMPGFTLFEARIAFMLKEEKFRYMAVSDNMQGYMPLPEDREAGRGVELAYKEAVLLVDPIEPQFRGLVDDKYQYSCENKDCKVHGWICIEPSVGFWVISPSNEFKTGGPTKQDLTCHVGPATLAMFISSHYGGPDMGLKFEDGEPWKKVVGPVFIYLNSVSDGSQSFSLWDDAKKQMEAEVRSWPYEFPNSEDFPRSDQRGVVNGRLLVLESERLVPAKKAYVGLAPPGEPGSWEKEGKGYQFWTRADDQGYFKIEKIRAGDYNLFAWVPDFVGDYHSNYTITITPGKQMKIGDAVYKPPRFGPTLWEIGMPDRSSAEFYIPDPNPAYPNNLYDRHPERFRQYGLWDRYTDLYPDHDLVYTIGYSDCEQDWFFAHVNRKVGNEAYKATTWEIKFNLKNVYADETYNLLIVIAAAQYARLQVRVNDPQAEPLLTSHLIGKDNAIARHGIHGLYHLVPVKIPSDQLLQGENSILLTQAHNSSRFNGIMYDYIRLEGPPYYY